MPLLDITGLEVTFPARKSTLRAVDGLDLAIDPGEVVGIVGESGCGKSVTALAIMGLVDAPGQVHARRLSFAGQEMAGLSATARDRVRRTGSAMAMIFQDPLASLDPCYTVGYQIGEVLRVRGNDAERSNTVARRQRTLELLQQVEIPDAAARMQAWPHQLSGGMAQRVMIAMALAARPQLLIADEPTTALDVTVQAQVLALLRRLQADTGMALLLITHDLAVVAQVASRVVVMYAGQAVETGAIPVIFRASRHPYTQALLDALPEHNLANARLSALPGRVPGALDRPPGCLFAPRCRYVQPVCSEATPPLTGTAHAAVRCLFPLQAASTTAAAAP